MCPVMAGGAAPSSMEVLRKELRDDVRADLRAELRSFAQTISECVARSFTDCVAGVSLDVWDALQP